MRDEVNKNAYAPETCGQTDSPREVRPSLVGRLHQRRRQLEDELHKVCNSIDFCERNAGMVEIVEVILLSREKTDRPY